jgi:hypothetical protein
VNALIGISFMTATKLVVDLDDSVIESKLLPCDPFPIIYKRPQRSMPNLVPITGNRSEKCLEVINAIETADAFINKVVTNIRFLRMGETILESKTRSHVISQAPWILLKSPSLSGRSLVPLL